MLYAEQVGSQKAPHTPGEVLGWPINFSLLSSFASIVSLIMFFSLKI
jgi:hypothetical protein